MLTGKATEGRRRFARGQKFTLSTPGIEAAAEYRSAVSGARASAGLARDVASAGALGMLVFVVLAFGALTYASVVSDFSHVDPL